MNIITSNGKDATPTKSRAIKDFYENATILVTGGTGFLGKVLIEKILRTCIDVRCVYILIRPKKNLNSEQRYAELIKNPVSVCATYSYF